MAAPDMGQARVRWIRYVLITALLVVGGLAAAVLSRPGSGGLARARDVLEYVAGVFALLALTEVVLSGVAAAEQLVPTRFRITIQSTHRATTVIAVGFLVAHVVLKITEGHAAALDAVVPFAADHRRAVYVGLGTLASDLLIVVAVTGMMRPRFAASRWPWLWRSAHVLSYAVWPLAVLHGLLAGRAAKSWVIWSYVICAGLILLAVASRLPRLMRERREISQRISGKDDGVPNPAVPDPDVDPEERFWPPFPSTMAGRPGERR
jgi:DMSO/TMAO reductase YedYZ heme-binding membrane subunit